MFIQLNIIFDLDYLRIKHLILKMKEILLSRINSTFKIERSNLFGEGRYGKVYGGFKDNYEIAIKVISKNILDKYHDLLQREVDILEKLNIEPHSNIIEFYGSVIKDGDAYLFFQKCQQNLEKITEVKLQEDVIKRYFKDIISGLNYIHQHNIIHRDLKPDNVLLGPQGNLKISDFGLSRQFEVDSIKMTQFRGSIAYRSPESKSKIYDMRSDVWSAGLILYKMLTGVFCVQFDIKTEKDIQSRNKNFGSNISLNFEGVDQIWSQLLKRMLIYDYKSRATSSQIYQMYMQWYHSNKTNLNSEKEQQKMEGIPNLFKRLQLERQQPITDIQMDNKLTILGEKDSFQQLEKYLRYLTFVYEKIKYCYQIQQDLLKLLKNNAPLKQKYSNFYILSVFFIRNTLIALKCKEILREEHTNNQCLTLPDAFFNPHALSKEQWQNYTTLGLAKRASLEKIVAQYDLYQVDKINKIESYKDKLPAQYKKQVQPFFKVLQQTRTDIHKCKSDLLDCLKMISNNRDKPDYASMDKSELLLHYLLNKLGQSHQEMPDHQYQNIELMLNKLKQSIIENITQDEIKNYLIKTTQSKIQQ